MKSLAMDRIAVVNEVLASLGTIVRREREGTLDEGTFVVLSTFMRAKLKALRIDLDRDRMPAGIELTKLGADVAGMLSAGLIMTGADLLNALPNRTRVVGRFAVIDGGRRDGARPEPTEIPDIGA